MGKQMLTALLAMVLGAATVQAQTVTAVRVTAERTSLRDKPATDGSVVATVTKGEELEVLESSGAWYRVRLRATAREGFVHNLFVERVTVAAGAPPARPSAQPVASAPVAAPAGAAPAAAAPLAATTSQRVPGVAPPAPLGGRKLGIGLAGGGVAFGFTPSLRFWTNQKLGFEVNASFLDSYGYSVTTISPSVISRFGDQKRAGTVGFSPYWGAGLQLWRYSTAFDDYYCGLRGADCDRGSIGFGGFGGTEVLFEAVPKMTASASVGFYTAPDALGYGGLFLSVSGHWYFK